jgi:hypothetical protein
VRVRGALAARLLGDRCLECTVLALRAQGARR